jgi:hypothetical protein
MNQITIKLSPLLSEEVYGRTVETGLCDHEAGTDVGLTIADLSNYAQIKKGSTIVVSTPDEAASLYNDLYNLLDFFAEWAEQDDDGIKWYAVIRAAKKNMAKLMAAGFDTNSHGWAIDRSAKAPVPGKAVA